MERRPSKKDTPEGRSTSRPSGRQIKPTPSRQQKNKETVDATTVVPPRKKKSDVLTLKHWRVRTVDVRQTEAIARQRAIDLNDLVRRQYERGVLIDTALGAPGEDGLYGLLRGARLAELLRPDIDGLINFALVQGMVPTLLQEYRGIIQNLNESLQSLRMSTATHPPGEGRETPPIHPSPADSMTHLPTTEVAEEVEGILDMFFSEADQEPDE